MKENSTISCYDSHSRQYDLYQSEVVPCYQEALDVAARACSRYLGKNPTILDLGCGTGNASAAVLREVPARIFLLDGSGEMVGAAEDKIVSAWPQAVLGRRVADISDEGWDKDLVAGRFDAVISTFVLEHLPFDDYRSAIGACYRLLRPGGWLIAIEGYREDEGDLTEWFNQEMEARRSNLDAALSEFVAGLRSSREAHYYCSKRQKEEWWREAGFSEVNILWQYLCMALMAGKKPETQ